MAGKVQILAQSILRISWEERFEQRPSQVSLMREYLRRSAWWSKTVGSGWPFSDFASQINPSMRADPEIVKEVRDSVPSWSFPLVRDTCEWALHFRNLKEEGFPIPQLPDPFDPLLIMYARGSVFSFSQGGFIDVDLVGVPRGRLHDWLAEEPSAVIDREKLDKMDGGDVVQ